MLARTILLVSTLFYTHAAYAVFDLQLYAGRRSVDSLNDGSDDLTGTSYGAAFHLSPIPLLPVAFGVAAEYTDYGTADGFSEITGYTVIPQIYAWMPLGLISLHPFIKLGYGFGAVTSEGRILTVKHKAAFRIMGTHMTAGFRWQPPVVPFISLLFQYDFGFEKSSVMSYEVGGVKVSTDKKGSFDSQAWQLGVEIGF